MTPKEATDHVTAKLFQAAWDTANANWQAWGFTCRKEAYASLIRACYRELLEEGIATEEEP